MKTITKFLINLISVGSIVLIATLNISQFAVVGQPIINTPDRPPNPIPGGPRFIQPTEDIDERPPTQPGRPVRGGCASISQLGLTALVPTNKIGRTVFDYPTFFFYLPQTEAESAEFILQDQSGKQIYKQDLTISNLSGVIGVSIPANKNVPPLEVGQSYTWNFTVICDAQDRSADQMESGTVRRVELSADIRRQLDQADPRQKTVIYAENGIWQDALSTLAAARRDQPNDTALKADWESLLDSVTLGKIAKEPIVQTKPQP
ncbi:DUF928 domain-containing protein [Microcoleus vaginatus PCC 9802]|uniref:DUF928 domain-containing protein n=1 Tax=Microcoleus vaginatus TaxID=119532 RepID=UPI00020D2853|nr:protein of unknown function DUF928 [Microcoleus vaginatus FGP-2]UNU18440.1 DUF928 domain-containing protein [Microcoleus vaginatus PCC 9802]